VPERARFFSPEDPRAQARALASGAAGLTPPTSVDRDAMPFGHPVCSCFAAQRRNAAPWAVTRWCAALVVVLAGCPPLPPPPGDEKLGEYTIAAEPVRGLEDGGVGALRPDGGLWCPLVDVVPEAFRFSATVTRETSTGQAWLTLGGGYPRDAGWDGQVLDSVAAVRRLFPSCGGCRTTIATERIRFALMSRSQSEAVGRACPTNPLDGGVPAPPGPDGGITGPGQTAEGFDALYACGELEFSVALQDAGAPEPDCAPGCEDCVVNYTLVGERR
jgi:hypothetical protein